MHSQLTAFITLICTSAVLNLYLCVSVFLKRHHYTNIANFFVYYTATIGVYCFASAMGLLATTLEQIKFWTIIQYVGMPVSSPLGLLFIMKYLGFKVTKKRIIALFTIPFVTLLSVATNDWHHFHYRMYEIDPTLGAPFIQQEIGIGYMIHGVFIFACMFVALLLLISRWKETAKVYRPQLISLMFGQLVPILTAFLYLIGLTPPGIDPVPMVLWLSSLLYLWAISSSRLFAIMPIAKNTIFNSINDGVMVLDESYRIIEFNQACQNSFPKLNKSMLGMEFDKVWLELSGNALPLKLETISQEVQVETDRSQYIYQVRTSSLEHINNNKGQLIIFTDITELKRLQKKLEQQAFYDELTQIHNRRAFLQQSEKDFATAKETSMPFTIMLMDIDHFKRVNDTYGHHIGDQVLVHVAKVCQAQLQDGQFFARYGGEEFVLALNGYTEVDAEKLGNELRRNLELQPHITAEGIISITLSIGVAEAVDGEADETLYQLLHNADQALYTAKQEGRNQVRAYNRMKEFVK